MWYHVNEKRHQDTYEYITRMLQPYEINIGLEKHSSRVYLPPRPRL